MTEFYKLPRTADGLADYEKAASDMVDATVYSGKHVTEVFVAYFKEVAADAGMRERDRLKEVNAELLEALEEALDALNGAPNTEGLHHMIRAAIAKAKGES